MRAVVLIYVAVWAVGVSVLVWLLAQFVVMDAVGHCNLSFLGPEPTPDPPPEPAEPYCTVAQTVLLAQALFVAVLLIPTSPVLSLLPWAVLALLVIDVVLPWWRARRTSGQGARSP